LIRDLSYGCLLLFWVFQLYALSGVPTAEDRPAAPRRKRFGALYRHQPWPAFTALFFLAAGTVCQILYFV
jgi:predicted MFS family arabinose efflux permease